MNRYFNGTMEKQAAMMLTVAVVVASLTGTVLLAGVPKLHRYSLHLQSVTDSAVWRGDSVLSLLRDDSKLLEMSEEYVQAQKHQLRFELPMNVEASSISYEQDYINRTFTITIPGIGQTYLYDFPMVGRADHIVDLFYGTSQDEGQITIQMDGIYELSVIAEGRYVYLDFPLPREVYDYLVVVDAGHGGKDVGAVIAGVEEKDINLAIAQKMQKIFDEEDHNIGVYFTRCDDTNPSLQTRAAMANDIGADLFLSIHNNSTASGRMSGIHGTEVMYLVADPTGQSKAFAERVLNHLIGELGSSSKGLIAGDEIYIIRTAQMPVALAEIGFMTNKEELAALSSEEYQEKAARAMVDAVYETLEVTK